MYKYLQVIEGKNTWDFTVKAAGTLSIVFTATKVHTAEVSLRVRLQGRGAKATVTGIVVAGDGQNVSVRTIQLHEAPDTTSDVLVKTVLSGRAVCLYDGSIRIASAAHKADAYQRNENLLLSRHATMESKPSLEILANDVHCKHGAATGSVNAEQLWYLMSRGIPRGEAEALITNGFIQSALDRIPVGKRGIISL